MSRLTLYPTLEQGSEEWLAARCGLLTASELKLIVSPSLKPASNDKERSHLFELLAQRITGHVEPKYITDDMLRGQEDEIDARALYAEHYAPVEELGFMVRDFGAFRIGYSPDGLVGDDGLIECKSRRQKYQVETILSGEVPAEYVIQVQTGLLVSGRKWLDFISYSGGLPMFVTRVYPDAKVQTAILDAASQFEERLAARLDVYRLALSAWPKVITTERRVEQEMVI